MNLSWLLETDRSACTSSLELNLERTALEQYYYKLDDSESR